MFGLEAVHPIGPVRHQPRGLSALFEPHVARIHFQKYQLPLGVLSKGVYSSHSCPRHSHMAGTTVAPGPQAASKAPTEEATKAPLGHPHPTDGGHLPAEAAAAAAGANKNKRCPCPNCRPPAPAPAGQAGGSGSKGSGSFSSNVRGAGSSGTGGQQQQGKGKVAAAAGGGGKAAAARKPAFNVTALPNKPLMPLPGKQEVQGQKVRPVHAACCLPFHEHC